MTLHIVSKPSDIGRCLDISREQDVLLLTEECWETAETLYFALKGASRDIYWLTDQVETAKPEYGVAVDYEGFVALCEAHTPIQSWY
ncbi:MAG: hypothetical protein VXZ35_12010 [Pseudomonadota bacterium]|nr:hypothetical protein [Pseudomonadota bacterium]